jgi:hypothetical protein
MLATQWVGEGEWLGQLFCADQESSAVSVPVVGTSFEHASCLVRKLLALSSWLLALKFCFSVVASQRIFAGWIFCCSVVNVRVAIGGVNSQILVQREIPTMKITVEDR